MSMKHSNKITDEPDPILGEIDQYRNYTDAGAVEGSKGDDIGSSAGTEFVGEIDTYSSDSTQRKVYCRCQFQEPNMGSRSMTRNQASA